MIQASKLATLGEMATGVAHELNQPLHIISLAAGNVTRAIELNRSSTEHVLQKMARIKKQVTRAAAIIDHMRMFGRVASEQYEPILPSTCIHGALDMLGEQLKLQNIDLTLDLADPETPFLGHPIQVGQVLLNLLANARDALLANRPHGRKSIRLSTTTDATIGEAVIAIEDNGGGIPEQVLGRIFEPFYTTKEIGKGTGLGLSVSYGIVHDMHGTIEAANTADGARFTLRLPPVDA